MWQTNAIGLLECDLGLPLSSSFTMAVITISPGTFQYTLYAMFHIIYIKDTCNRCYIKKDKRVKQIMAAIFKKQE
jgi:hypothetical protein